VRSRERTTSGTRAKLGAMPLSAITVDVPADPLAVAARLRDRPGFALVHDGSARGGRSFVAVDPVETSASLLPASDVLYENGDTRARVPRWMGAIPYEAGRGLERPQWTRRPDERATPHLVEPRWSRYAAVVEVDPSEGRVMVVGDDAPRVRALAADLRSGRQRGTDGARLEALPADEAPSAHVARVRRAKELIAAGDLYQVNLARRLRFRAHGPTLELYRRLAARVRPAFGACFDLGGVAVCAGSPELFLRVEPSGVIRTAPIKGTRPRGLDLAADQMQADELSKSAKEHAELTMILDVERNDLGRVTAPGTVRLSAGPYLESHPTVHHRLAVVEGRLRAGKTARDVVAAMFPSGSVTGAPKTRAMEVIAELEPVRRGLYTGAFGWVAFDGTVELAMAIRVLTLRAGEAHYYAGGGIVADSDPELELAETRWKGVQLEALI
jgi:anthranilate/para-aminobenzoate synthase component I